MNSLKSASLWIIFFLIFIVVFTQSWHDEQSEKITLSQWIDYAKAKVVKTALDRGNVLEGKLSENGVERNYQVNYVPGQEE